MPSLFCGQNGGDGDKLTLGAAFDRLRLDKHHPIAFEVCVVYGMTQKPRIILMV